jgi:capsular polysaccharide biosynthesis protein
MKSFPKIIGILLIASSVVLLISGVVQFILPPVYQAGVTISMPAETPAIPPNNVLTLADTILSKAILNRVITNLDLNRKWGEKFKEDTLSTDTTYLLLKKDIVVSRSPNHNVLEIRVRSDAPAEAAAVANEIARVYGDKEEQAQWRIAQESSITLLEQELTRIDDRVLRETLNKRVKAEKAALVVPHRTVEIIEQAEPNLRPVKPSPALKILFPAMGALIGVVGIIVLIFNSFSTKRSQPGPPPLPSRV